MTNTQTALKALNDLVDTAREMRTTRTASTPQQVDVLTAVTLLEVSLDATRTALVQEGDTYLDTAWAFIDAGSKLLATSRVQVGRAFGEVEQS